jgi:hypothetical protein
LYYGSEIGMAGAKDKEMQLFVKIFQVGMAMQTMHLQRRTNCNPKNEYFDFTAKLFTWQKQKTAIHTGKMTHYIPENNMPILDTTIMKQ